MTKRAGSLKRHLYMSKEAEQKRTGLCGTQVG